MSLCTTLRKINFDAVVTNELICSAIGHFNGIGTKILKSVAHVRQLEVIDPQKADVCAISGYEAVCFDPDL
eukprot:4618365-Prorocentrum_lima.AAC.1